MKLYFVSLGIDGEFEETHRFLFRVGESPLEVLSKIKEELRDLNFHFDTLVEVNYADGRRVMVGEESEEKLFAVFSGFYTKGSPLENHGIIFVAAKDQAEAKSKARALLKAMDAITPHVDGIKEISQVEGRAIGVRSAEGSPNLFLYHNDIKSLLEEGR